jgi:hypothetical protein
MGAKIRRGAHAAAAGVSSVALEPSVRSPILIPKNKAKLSTQEDRKSVV